MEGIFFAISLLLVLAALLIRRQPRRTQRLDFILPEPNVSARLIVAERRIAIIATDAAALLQRVYDTKPISRRKMVSRGMSERRWNNAVRLLRTLKVFPVYDVSPICSQRHATLRLNKWHKSQLANARHSARYISNV
jgi:hypothetical protein